MLSWLFRFSIHKLRLQSQNSIMLAHKVYLWLSVALNESYGLKRHEFIKQMAHRSNILHADNVTYELSTFLDIAHFADRCKRSYYPVDHFFALFLAFSFSICISSFCCNTKWILKCVATKRQCNHYFFFWSGETADTDHSYMQWETSCSWSLVRKNELNLDVFMRMFPWFNTLTVARMYFSIIM